LESISHKQHNQLLQISQEKCQHKNPTQYFDITLKMVDLVETSHLFLTNSVSLIKLCCSLYIQMSDNGAHCTQHILFIFLIPSLLTLSIGSYFIWFEYCEKNWTRFTFVVFKQYPCTFCYDFRRHIHVM
jgi:hypothetical protein